MVYIRADANQAIGTGHVMRCLSIAEDMRRQGEGVTFLTADRDSEKIIAAKEYPVICLHSVWNDLEKELDVLLSVIRERQIRVLIIDSYYVTKRYLERLHDHTKLIYIDDLELFPYPVDLLVNYNIYAELPDYEKRYQCAGLSAKFALGCSYAPLRAEFQKGAVERSGQIGSIMITSGGSDQYDVIGHLLEAFSRMPWFADIRYDVILGSFYPDRKVLEKRWEQSGNICFHVNVANMSDYMRQCDAAITAGGSTTYELCACGIPSILYTLADNQLKLARAVSEMGIMPWAGDVREDMETCVENIISEIERLRENPKIYQNRSCDMMRLVDARGASRIVEQIKNI